MLTPKPCPKRSHTPCKCSRGAAAASTGRGAQVPGIVTLGGTVPTPGTQAETNLKNAFQKDMAAKLGASSAIAPERVFAASNEHA